MCQWASLRVHVASRYRVVADETHGNPDWGFLRVNDELFYKRVLPLRHLDVPSLDAALRDAAGASAFIERAIPAGEPF